MSKKNQADILVHSNYSPQNHGGIEFVVSTLLQNIPKKNKLTCFYGGGVNASFVSADSIRYVSRRIIFSLAGASVLSWGNFSFIFTSLRSKLIIFQEPYPTLWPAIFFIRFFLRKKIIVLIHANPVSNIWIMRIYDRVRSLIFSGAICVTTSPNLLNQIKSSLFSKALVIPLCIPSQVFTLAWSLSLPNRYALYIGRLARYKGIEYILESSRICPNVNFVIAGDGPLNDYVSSFIRINKITNIYFINRFVTESEKYELIERSSFVLFPSVSENEAFGLVQLEAMRSKKAIINTWLDSGVNYVAPNQISAITIKPKNYNELSEAIQILWSDVALATKLGKNGFTRFQLLFQEKLFVDSWNSLLNECLFMQDVV